MVLRRWETENKNLVLSNELIKVELSPCERFSKLTSSETQGQFVGSIECPWGKFTVRSRRTPGQLLLPNQFQKRLNCPLLMSQKKSSGQSAKSSSRVTLMFSSTT